MKIECEQRGNYLLIETIGRLDANWANYFADTLLLQIREGQHCMIIDAAQMSFLSSAGIRALLIVYKELHKVQGRFSIARPSSFVEQTLRMSGFEKWLEQEFPEDMPAANSENAAANEITDGLQYFSLQKNAQLTLSAPATWRPWQMVEESTLTTVSFDQDSYALGIGSAAATFEEAQDRLGEFLAVAGNVAFQSPQEQGPPDYLLPEGDFVPRLQCAQAMCFKGEMAHLIRFSPTPSRPFFPMSTLLADILKQTGESTAGFVVLAEIEGLVGTALIQSPGRIEKDREIPFPELRDWLTFCGERCHSHQQVLLTGIVSTTSHGLLPSLPSRPELAAHIHAAIFPYQPLPNGQIDLNTSIEKFFQGPPPLAVMHLAEDPRPVIGLGESALIRGACWFGPLQNLEVLS